MSTVFPYPWRISLAWKSPLIFMTNAKFDPAQPSVVKFFRYLLIIIYLFIKKPYTTVLQTKWFMIANDLKGGADNKSNLQPKAS